MSHIKETEKKIIEIISGYAEDCEFYLGLKPPGVPECTFPDRQYVLDKCVGIRCPLI